LETARHIGVVPGAGFAKVAAVMKTPYAIGWEVTAVFITVAIEETRISGMRKEVATPASAVAAQAPARNGTEPETPVRTKSRAELKPTSPAKPAEQDDESLAKTVRKMWDNPAGKSMMNQGVKIAVAMMYGDFIDGLDLTKEEADYFKGLLGKEMSNQQELGMKMMSATDDERTSLMEEMKQRDLDNDEAIKTFLNNEEDYKSFTEYKERLPERQQLDGIRATMESKGAPLDAETETRLVDAMHKVRTETKGSDFSGPEALQEMAKGNMVETYEKGWQSQQEVLRAETAEFLTPAQQEAFQEYQQQMKEMQLMGLKMAEKMMNHGKDYSN